MKLWQAFALIAVQVAIVLAALASVEAEHGGLAPMSALPENLTTRLETLENDVFALKERK